jgi:hypothetical protein
MYEIGMAKAIQIDDIDNVATVTSEVFKGEQVEVLSPVGSLLIRAELLGDVPFGHKKVGEWLHTHNVESIRVPTSKFQEATA